MPQELAKEYDDFSESDLSKYHAFLVQVTLSEASSRHSQHLHANHTLEGRHLRCFENLGMCRFEQVCLLFGEQLANKMCWENGC